MNRIGRTNAPTAEDEEREALTPADYQAAGVEPPNWAADPIPTHETCRRWRKPQKEARPQTLAAARANR
jgi:hypothetical protein